MDLKNIAGNQKAMHEVNRFGKKMEDKMKNTVVESENDFFIMGFNLEFDLETFKFKGGTRSQKDIENGFKECFCKIHKHIKTKQEEMRKEIMEKSQEIQKRYI